jgi:hypothetical protein
MLNGSGYAGWELVTLALGVYIGLISLQTLPFALTFDYKFENHLGTGPAEARRSLILKACSSWNPLCSRNVSGRKRV